MTTMWSGGSTSTDDIWHEIRKMIRDLYATETENDQLAARIPELERIIEELEHENVRADRAIAQLGRTIRTVASERDVALREAEALRDALDQMRQVVRDKLLPAANESLKDLWVADHIFMDTLFRRVDALLDDWIRS